MIVAVTVAYPFNPILVWFYHEVRLRRERYGCLSIPFWSDFIATPRREDGADLKILSIPFWSDFIRAIKAVVEKLTADFQSHFGLILSNGTAGVSIIQNSFQSHFGLILSYCVSHCEFCSLRVLSIPFWSDFIVGEIDNHCVNLRHLSIPFWSDFIHRDDEGIHTLGTAHFQSHFGLILSCEDCVGWRLQLSGALSIPFWSDFIEKLRKEKEEETKNFQSHFGLILSTVLLLNIVKNWLTFNPILVWFYRAWSLVWL